jgi:hypothetical protein
VISAQIAGHAAAGAASDSSGWVLIAVAAAAWAGWWCWHAWRHPYRPCWRCDGTGRNNGSTRKRYGTCRTCKGTGRQIRLGARLFHRTLTRGRR